MGAFAQERFIPRSIKVHVLLHCDVSLSSHLQSQCQPKDLKVLKDGVSLTLAFALSL